MPAVAARTTYPIVSALPKLGMPTMRSALPTRRTSASPCSSSAEPVPADAWDVRGGASSQVLSRFWLQVRSGVREG